MAENQIITSEEIWKPIPGFPGYDVSDHGNVRSYYRRSYLGWVLANTPQRILRPSINGGYFQVNLWDDGQKHHYLIHQLVLMVFVGPCPPDYESRHLDGNRAKNYLSNLEWGTRVENMADKIEHGTHQKGINNGRVVLSEEQVKQIRELYPQGHTLKKLGKMFGVNFSTIAAIVKRRNWKHI